MKLTAKQKKFARNIVAKEMTQTDAYRDAYDTENMADKTIKEKASIEARKDNVRASIDKLRDEYAEYFNYDAKQHFEDMKFQRELAMTPAGDNGTVNNNAAIRATELMGKMTGKYVEKSELDVNHTGNISVNIVTGSK